MADLGTLSSLGIGSGVLNYDVIDKLKNADTDIMVKPMEDKVDLLKKKESALSQFITIGATVKGDISDIADGTLFAKVTTNVIGSSVEVTANDGVKPQEFSINVTQLAQNDIYESNGFASMDSIINTSSNPITLNLGVGDVFTSITLQAGATLNDLKDAINNANAGVTASIIDTGIGDNPYKLVIKANETGADNVIKLDYSQIEDLGFNQTTYKSATFTSDTDVINNSGSTQTFSIDINGTTYSMDVTNGMSVSDFVNALNNGELKDSEGNSLKMNASFNTNTGQIEFNLNAIGDITINDSNLLTNFNDNTDFTNANRLQTAQNSKFTYNGVEVERSSNTIEDLITGVTINLKSTGESSVKIESGVDDIVEAIKKFVADYNSMVSNIQSLTAYNKDTGDVGLFQGDSDFTMLESIFSGDLFGTTYTYKTDAYDRNGNLYTQNQFFNATTVGFDMDRNGMISFDETKFKEAFEQNSDITQNWFETTFTKLNNDFERTITGDKSNLSLLDQNIKDEEKRYEDRIDAMKKFLDTKYEIMAKQFAAYDEMINKFNAMSNSLLMVINQEINNTN
ncbi:flagellar filament capping protein FliD [Caminibacter mediatlanticus]|uniref:Flagellar hook-associated protein 2 n=1 Tax=Caminibacter mediatlanticus TB-2 TaxID=391592 RepID=A0AAI9F354_9BACT|nr:flagellar filament capping protein FliD [Caminibacter mediatlanticus]EDM24499.1 flagellar capping protein [Caminibacter mediatlanticus TB-2]